MSSCFSTLCSPERAIISELHDEGKKRKFCKQLFKKKKEQTVVQCLVHAYSFSMNWNKSIHVIFFKVGSLTWDPSETAEFYSVTAESNSGHKVQLGTNETWAFIAEFLCGQEYFLSVQAVDSVCTSQPSLPSRLMSGGFICPNSLWCPISTFFISPVFFLRHVCILVKNKSNQFNSEWLKTNVFFLIVSFLGDLNHVSSSSPRAMPSHRRSQLHELPVQHRCGVLERLGRGRVLHGHGDAGRRPVGQLLVRQRAVRDAQHTVRAELHGDSGGLKRAV